VTAGSLPPFHERLLAWWDRNGRQDLPWQHPRTPYRVWISEIMLQQTQVSTVIPYFERWMRSFPDISDLARATEDEVLAHWAGLGYYARARNLHRGAKKCLETFGGDLPMDADDLAGLPGIGRSTANAIVSQASDRPAAVLDGNVRRLLARHAAVEGPTTTSAVQKLLWAEAEGRLPRDRGADYTQAVMDLGALVCTRSRPACERCPVAADCEALRQDRVDQLPSAKPATKVGERHLCWLILTDEKGRILLEKRPPTGIWGGLWCLPEGRDAGSIAARLGITVNGADALPRIEHRLTHLRLVIEPLLAAAGPARQVQCSNERNWFDRPGLAKLGLPKPVAECLDRLNDGASA
jgi:A/G-specific adenine glycosylase